MRARSEELNRQKQEADKQKVDAEKDKPKKLFVPPTF
jgi:hypothetical protein